MKKKVFLIIALVTFVTAVAAQTSFVRRTIASTGLFSLTRGHVAILTVADVGLDRDASAPVRLQILNDKNEVIAEERGILQPGHPLVLRTDAAHITDLRVPVRARVQVVTTPRFPRRRAPTPVLTFEFLNEDTLDVEVGVSCPIPASTGGRGPEFNCPPPCDINVI